MSPVSDKQGEFWKYLSQTQKDLILEGEYLMKMFAANTEHAFKDYSFLVFPFAKTFEGFLKQLFLDVKFISHLDYISEHYRLGKFMSPNLMNRLGDRSLYKRMVDTVGKQIAHRVWCNWKVGRNQIFHYFSHNLRAVSYKDAELLVNEMIESMEALYGAYQTHLKQRSAEGYIRPKEKPAMESLTACLYNTEEK